MATANIHLIFPETTGLDADRLLLSEQERSRADRFAFSGDARRWTIYRAALRRLLGEYLSLPADRVPLAVARGGKPCLASPHRLLEFNLSHADDLAVLIVSRDGPVGIDLEPCDRASSLLDCAAVFCHPDELEALPNDESTRATELLKIWTAKEALLKAIGTGLLYPPQDLRLTKTCGIAESPLPGLEQFHLYRPVHPSLARHEICTALPQAIERVDLCL